MDIIQVLVHSSEIKSEVAQMNCSRQNSGTPRPKTLIFGLDSRIFSEMEFVW